MTVSFPTAQHLVDNIFSNLSTEELSVCSSVCSNWRGPAFVLRIERLINDLFAAIANYQTAEDFYFDGDIIGSHYVDKARRLFSYISENKKIVLMLGPRLLSNINKVFTELLLADAPVLKHIPIPYNDWKSHILDKSQKISSETFLLLLENAPMAPHTQAKIVLAKTLMSPKIKDYAITDSATEDFYFKSKLESYIRTADPNLDDENIRNALVNDPRSILGR